MPDRVLVWGSDFYVISGCFSAIMDESGAFSVKSSEEINRLSASDAKAYAKQLSASYKCLVDRLFKPETGIIARLESQLAISQKVNEALIRQLNKVERTSISNSQYARRETLEFHGIPENFDSNLEEKVIALVNDIAPDANVVSADIQAIHRMKNKKNVIVKFVSRKKKHLVIKGRAKLRQESIKRGHGIQGNVFLNESMCLEMKRLFYLCKKLKEKGKIAYYSFFNGNLKVKKGENDQFEYIGHIKDLVEISGSTLEYVESLEN